MDELSKLPSLKVDEMATSGPVMLDLFSGENAPLAQAFNWCGWRVVTPIDIAIDMDFDVTRPAVRRAILHVLPEVSLLSAASRVLQSRGHVKSSLDPSLFVRRHIPGAFLH